jgi:hypothetical protein
MAERTIRDKAQQLAESLGISVWLRADGTCHQHGPGEELRPSARALPAPHGDTPVSKQMDG